MRQRLRKNDRCCRAVARGIVCFRRRFLDELGAHILKFILKLDFFCDCYAVVRDLWRAKALIENNIPPSWPERNFYRIRDLIHPVFQGLSRFLIELYLFSHDCLNFRTK